MNCEETRELVDAKLLREKQGVQAPETDRLLDLHLSTCSGCKDYVESVRYLDALVSKRSMPMPSASFVPGVLAKLNQPEPTALAGPIAARSATRETLRRPFSFPLSAIASLAAVLLIGFVLRERAELFRDAANRQLKSGTSLVSITDDPNPLRKAGSAYAQLMQNVAVSVISDNGLALGEANQGSDVSSIAPTQTIREAGAEIQSTVRPIASSAAGAFGFLWRSDKSSAQKPST